MMTPIYRGFDGLDVSFAGHIPSEFAVILEDAKQHAQNASIETCLRHAGIAMMVAGTGARGGYAYRVSTGRTGATWFFKKPNTGDPWGVRVSCSSFVLAERGLNSTIASLYLTMEQLGIRLTKLPESISRVDFAVDIIAPTFELIPQNFVMHSNTNRADYFSADEITTNGKSGQYTSVTIGKMPGRQLIVYDKRAEVIAKKKFAWFEIWNANCDELGVARLDFQDSSHSRVWRTEIRAGKKHLKDRWNIRTWADLYARFGDLVSDAAEAVRLTQPIDDKNRSRWPNSEFWALAKMALEDDLFDMRNFCPPDTVKRVDKEAHRRLLAQQGLGLLITQAAISGITIDDLANFARSFGESSAHEIESNLARMEIRLAKSAMRYEAKA